MQCRANRVVATKMISASLWSAESTSTYAYGPTGMRERVTVESAEGTATTTLAWSGSTLAMSRTVTGGGGKYGTDTTYTFVYGPDSLPLELIVTPLGGQPVSYAYLCDRAGSVIALTDSAGAVVATYAYDPYGAPTLQPASGIGARNPLRYRGYYYDVATALYYLPARYYDPAVARFLSPDPAAPSAGDPLSLNRYAYCVGDPVNADDPTGAVMDIDGDGRVDSEDTISESYVHTPSGSPLKAIRKAKMNVAVYAAHGTAQQLIGAQADYYNLVGWPIFPGASSGAQAGGTSSPFSDWAYHSNGSLLPTRPDAVGWGLMGAGMVGDVATGCGVITTVAAPPAGAAALRYIKRYNMIVDGSGVLYAGYQMAWTKQGSAGDMAVAGISFMPGFSTAVLLTHIGLMVADGAGANVYCEP